MVLQTKENAAEKTYSFGEQKKLTPESDFHASVRLHLRVVRFLKYVPHHSPICKPSEKQSAECSRASDKPQRR